MKVTTATLMIITGLTSGVVGAVVVGHMQARPPAPASSIAVAAPSQARPLIVPPGWDPALVDRLAHVERRIDDLQAHGSPGDNGAAKPIGSQSPINREQDRTERYQKELTYQSQFLADHAQEPIDHDWAETAAHHIESAVADVSAPLAGVDCRSKTCVATLDFPSPSDALTYIQQGHSLPVADCPGVTVIPTPPTDDGDYHLSVLFSCR